MENPFKKIVDNEKAPEILRDKVMQDVRLIKLSLDVADLFTVKSPSMLLDIMKSVPKKKS
ncbi:MAG: hypothetical protein ACK5IC_01200 [Moheibacter sp.]